jgi:hypothetical protein
MEAKDQHYIPKFYLKGFTDKGGTLWVCEQFKPIKASRPKLEAHRPDYYTHSERGERDETVEELLKKIESNVAPVIRKIGNPQYNLTPEAAGRILEFAAFMFARVPSWREYLDKLTGQHVKAIAMRSASSEEKFRQLCSDFEQSSI